MLFVTGRHLPLIVQSSMILPPDSQLIFGMQTQSKASYRLPFASS